MNSLKFENELKNFPSTLRVMNIIGEGVDTAASVFSVGKGTERKHIFPIDDPKQSGLDPHLILTDGDGVVPRFSSELPKAMLNNSTLKKTDSSHNEQFGDKEVGDIINEFLSN